jgi:hypothetical protein
MRLSTLGGVDVCAVSRVQYPTQHVPIQERARELNSLGDRLLHTFFEKKRKKNASFYCV